MAEISETLKTNTLEIATPATKMKTSKTAINLLFFTFYYKFFGLFGQTIFGVTTYNNI